MTYRGVEMWLQALEKDDSLDACMRRLAPEKEPGTHLKKKRGPELALAPI